MTEPHRKKLKVAFLWHMHQPYYKNLADNEHKMPWVWLHGIRNYLSMPLLLREYPEVKSHFNLVPCLVEQIMRYAKGDTQEELLRLFIKNASELTEEDKAVFCEKFFQANYETMIWPFERYAELFRRCKWTKERQSSGINQNTFTEQDYRDLQTLFILAWIAPCIRKKDPLLKSLEARGRNFSEDDKTHLMKVIQRILNEIVTTYKKMHLSGQIELSTSPYYHPILPLLYDTDFARRPRKKSLLPKERFHHPEDAKAQIEMATDFHHTTFGIKPHGMWPSEGSVCPELIPLFQEVDIRWIATDEGILSSSLDKRPFARDPDGMLSVQDMRTLYKPYIAEYTPEGTDAAARVVVFFRDHFLSDLIGFHYCRWDSAHAAEDFVARCETIREQLAHDQDKYIMSIILDGENCWEYYHNNGETFLRTLYAKLSESETLETVTYSDYLEHVPPQQTLPALATGSWINHDFHIWIGQTEDVKSWDLLTEARTSVERQIEQKRDELDPHAIELARKEICIAEGSDWNWWYGDDHSSHNDLIFDTIYRDHIANAYRFVDLPVPSSVSVPIVATGKIVDLLQPISFICPVLDGKSTNYFEWSAAGCYNACYRGGTMHQAHKIVQRIFFGFDAWRLYIRVDPSFELIHPYTKGKNLTFILMILSPRGWQVKTTVGPDTSGTLEAQCYQEVKDKGWEFSHVLDSVSFNEVLEYALPFDKFELQPHDIVHFQVTVAAEEKEIERCPPHTTIQCEIPDKDYEAKLWLV